jgi:hypothetical protein
MIGPATVARWTFATFEFAPIAAAPAVSVHYLPVFVMAILQLTRIPMVAQASWSACLNSFHYFAVSSNGMLFGV